MRTRPLSPRHPRSPAVPVIGMGTSGTLDTDDHHLATDVVTAALDAGTTLFDSSPMYGRAEAALGRALGDRRREAVVATKVWTADDDTAERQLDASLGFAGGHVELMQVHNMVEWPRRLDQTEERRSRGEIDWIGVTHWKVDGFDDVEEAMRTGRVDVVQLPYNPVERDVEKRLLPLAADLGIGVLVMRPFANGALFDRAPGEKDLAALGDAGVRSAADALLGWVLGHPAVTAAMPATSRAERARTNPRCGDIELDPDQRERIATLFRP